MPTPKRDLKGSTVVAAPPDGLNEDMIPAKLEVDAETTTVIDWLPVPTVPLVSKAANTTLLPCCLRKAPVLATAEWSSARLVRNIQQFEATTVVV